MTAAKMCSSAGDPEGTGTRAGISVRLCQHSYLPAYYRRTAWSRAGAPMSLRPWGRHLNFMMDGGRASAIISGYRSQPTSAWLAAVAKAALEQLNLHPRRPRRRITPPPHPLRQWPLGAARATRARMVASAWKKTVPSIAASARQASGATTAKTTTAQERMIRSRTTRPTTHATHVPTTYLPQRRFRATTGRLAAWFSALTAAASRRQPRAWEHHQRQRLHQRLH